MINKNMILIVGSNGILGKHIVEKVIKSFGVENLVLSDYKPNRLAFQQENIGKKFGKQPLTKLIDIHSKESIKNGLHNIDFVVIAIQQKEPLIQRQCIENGINSIDLSVNPAFLEKALGLNTLIQEQNIQVITGGMFPGLSGILAKEISEKVPKNKPIDIGLLQSKNGTSGKTGASDMIQIFDKNVELIKQDSTIKYAGFSHKKPFVYPKPFGTKKLRLTNFIERDFLKDNGILSNYWTAFDKEDFNILISILKKIGFLKLFKYPKIRNVMSQLVAKEKTKKTNEYIGLSARSSNQEISIIFTSDYETTASCVTAFSKIILNNKTKDKGVKFPFELFTFDDIKTDLKDVIIE